MKRRGLSLLTVMTFALVSGVSIEAPERSGDAAVVLGVCAHAKRGWLKRGWARIKKGVRRAVGGIKQGLRRAGRAIVKGVKVIGAVIGAATVLATPLPVLEAGVHLLIQGPIATGTQNLVRGVATFVAELTPQALAVVRETVEKDVLQAALTFVTERLFGSEHLVLTTLQRVAERVLNSAQGLADRGQEIAEIMRAVAARDAGRFEKAMGAFRAGLEGWKKLGLADVARALLDDAKGALTAYVRGQTSALLDKALGRLEPKIRSAAARLAITALGIPVLGRIVVRQEKALLESALSKVRDGLAPALAQKAGELAGSVVEALRARLVGGAGALDKGLMAFVDKLRPWLDTAMGLVERARAKWLSLRDKLAQLGQRITKVAARDAERKVSR